MKRLLICLFVCATLQSVAQTNFVRNGNMETYSECPLDLNMINRAVYWSSIIDSASEKEGEYYNTCTKEVPVNGGFYQYPRSDSGMIGLNMYYDKTPPGPPSGLPADYRDYAQGRLYKSLTAGQTYCVSFWVNLMEFSYYAHNKIGAYLDNGAINKLPLPHGSEVNSVSPQVYTNTVVKDTANWTKIEGSFIATGNESYITIGVFSPNAMVDTAVTNYWLGAAQYSGYLLDDVSVIPIDLKADAGADRNVPLGQTNQIGRVGDTTATGLDCKWYHKGKLIDSGAVITVMSGSSVGVIDTYVVVQTVCGLVKTDTMLLRTVPTGLSPALSNGEGVSVQPNPSTGSFVIQASSPLSLTNAKVYDLLGRVIYNKQLSFTNNETSIELDAVDGIFILEIKDAEGEEYRHKVEIKK